MNWGLAMLLGMVVMFLVMGVGWLFLLAFGGRRR